ncbi:hypothetical protein BX600DRAFT_231675 [Xylariales sp. PMI_506]|nr:hypothetical protein BX600DRAFT_231675 [Xylariales sp. PMI_506]
MSLAPAADLRKSAASGLDEQSSTPPPHPVLDEKDEGLESSADRIKKRNLFGFAKKNNTDNKAVDADVLTPPKAGSGLPSPPPTQEVSLLSSQQSTQISSGAMDMPARTPSSPSRGIYSSSPHLTSPAGSQIFERDVQESTAVMPNSPAIPSHIQVENHIPPALDATSEAITDDHLNPDSVEIVTHASHQPAAVAVTGGLMYETQSSSWVDELQSLAEKEEGASNYGSLDSADVRRLSFISFADVVQAEQGVHGMAANSRDSMHLAGLTSLSSGGLNRSPSPIRSPISSQGPETSPPTSKSGSVKGLDMSPSRKPLGSPTSGHHSLGIASNSELNIETMSQALRRTGSREFNAARSVPISPIEGPSQ